MAHLDPPVTTVSTKGQVVLPRAIRQRQAWPAGTRLTVEETPDGILLRRAPVFSPSRPEDVFATLHRNGAPVSVEDMNAALLTEAQRRHAGD